MGCKRFKKKLIAAVDDGYLLESDPRLKKHLGVCPTCKTFYEELLRENEYLVNTGKSFAAPSGLNEKIIKSLPLVLPSRPIAFYRLLRYAVPACVLIFLAILLFHPRPRIGYVEWVRGPLQKKTLFGWKELYKRDIVHEKALLRTLAASRAKIVFEEGNYLRLEPESSVYLGARVHLDKDHIYRIEYGSIWAKVAHNYDGEFYIETPNSLIIRVLGTEFNVQALPDTNSLKGEE